MAEKSSFRMIHGLEAIIPLAGSLLKAQDAMAQLPRFRKLLEDRSASVFTIIMQTLHDVAPFAAAGLPIWISGSAQEAVDLSAVASASSRKNNLPVLHFLDETWAAGEFSKLKTGHARAPYEYSGHPEADRVFVAMGAEAESARAVVENLNARGETVGLVHVRQYRPFEAREFLQIFPSSARSLAVLEPLYQDVLTSLHEGITGGWSWFTAFPDMTSVPIADEKKPLTLPRIGTLFQTQLPTSHEIFEILIEGRKDDDTLPAVEEWAKIFGERTERFLQLHWVHGASGRFKGHLRIGKVPIHARCPIAHPRCVVLLTPSSPPDQDSLSSIAPGGILLTNGRFTFPDGLQEELLRKDVRAFETEMSVLSERAGLGDRISVGLQAALTALLDTEAWLNLSKEKAFEILSESYDKRWGDLSRDIVIAHQKVLRETQLDLSETSFTRERSPQKARSNAQDSMAKTELRPLWLGWKLRSPMIATLTFDATGETLEILDNNLGNNKIGAVFLGPILEDELRREAWTIYEAIYETAGNQSTASGVKPPAPRERYLAFLERVKGKTDRPVIVGLSAGENSDWLSLAFALEQRGADAIEIFLKPEEDLKKIAALACGAVKIPVGIRLTPYHADLPQLAREAAEAGAKAMTLFHHPPVSFADPRTRQTVSKQPVPPESLFWLALPPIQKMASECPLPLAASGPAPSAGDALLALSLGSKVVYVRPDVLKELS